MLPAGLLKIILRFFSDDLDIRGTSNVLYVDPEKCMRHHTVSNTSYWVWQQSYSVQVGRRICSFFSTSSSEIAGVINLLIMHLTHITEPLFCCRHRENKTWSPTLSQTKIVGAQSLIKTWCSKQINNSVSYQILFFKKYAQYFKQ